MVRQRQRVASQTTQHKSLVSKAALAFSVCLSRRRSSPDRSGSVHLQALPPLLRTALVPPPAAAARAHEDITRMSHPRRYLLPLSEADCSSSSARPWGAFSSALLAVWSPLICRITIGRPLARSWLQLSSLSPNHTTYPRPPADSVAQSAAPPASEGRCRGRRAPPTGAMRRLGTR